MFSPGIIARDALLSSGKIDKAETRGCSFAAKAEALAAKHRLHFQHVGVASLPDSYAERLVALAHGVFRRLRLFALDPHDLALSKLVRNSPIDREDVAQLARAVPLDPTLLRARYERELRPILIGDQERSDRTLRPWIEAYVRSP